MSKVIAIGNNKGGVAKTTTAVNLAKGLSDAGMRVLLVDADPQGNATAAVGYDEPDSIEDTLASVMIKEIKDVGHWINYSSLVIQSLKHWNLIQYMNSYCSGCCHCGGACFFVVCPEKCTTKEGAILL